MRNDARPIGHEQSPDRRDQRPVDNERSAIDGRPSVTHDRQSHIVNRGAEENARRDDADSDPAMPTGDSTLRTNI